MTRRKHWKRLKENEFKQLKAMMDAGISLSKVRELTGRGGAVCSFIKQNSSFDGYKKAMSLHRSQHPILRGVPEVFKTPNLETATAKYITNDTALIDILSQIRDELHNLVVTWERCPESKTKTGWFA